MPCPSDFCSNGGVVDTSGFVADKTCCDCSGTDYSGDACTLCTTTNEANTNCAALTDATIGNSHDAADDTAIKEWFANADTTAAEAKWGHIRDW